MAKRISPTAVDRLGSALTVLEWALARLTDLAIAFALGAVAMAALGPSGWAWPHVAALGGVVALIVPLALVYGVLVWRWERLNGSSVTP